MTETVLDKIKAYKLEEVAADKTQKSLETLEGEARMAPRGPRLCRSAPKGSSPRLWLDCRGQKGQPVQGIDPFGF